MIADVIRWQPMMVWKLLLLFGRRASALLPVPLKIERKLCLTISAGIARAHAEEHCAGYTIGWDEETQWQGIRSRS